MQLQHFIHIYVCLHEDHSRTTPDAKNETEKAHPLEADSEMGVEATVSHKPNPIEWLPLRESQAINKAWPRSPKILTKHRMEDKRAERRLPSTATRLVEVPVLEGY